jgi:hypothetical protein
MKTYEKIVNVKTWQYTCIGNHYKAGREPTPSQQKMTRTHSDSKIRLRGQSMPIQGVRQALSPIMSPRHSMNWLLVTRRIGDRLVRIVRSSDLNHWATRALHNHYEMSIKLNMWENVTNNTCKKIIKHIFK